MKKYYKVKKDIINLGRQMANSRAIRWGGYSSKYAIVDFDTNKASVYSTKGEPTFTWDFFDVDKKFLIEIDEEEFIYAIL